VNVLGIETATTVCGAAIVHNGKVIQECFLDRPAVHAEKLITLINEALQRAQLRLADIDGVAVSVGPGSFTGLRIGLSVAKGLVYVMGKPLIAVPTLYALAKKAVDARVVHLPGFVLAALDARREEVFCELFSVSDESIEPVWEERNMTVNELLQELGHRTITVTGNAAVGISKARNEGSHFPKAKIEFVNSDVAQCSAGTVALVGEQMLTQGKNDDPVTIEPHYLKDFFARAS
jgi:tRNA threonylcarbamoyladenosine biosynthesis protein TsaB